jgi:hypothetical protein
MQSAHGCPTSSAGSAYHFMEKYQYLVGANFMLIGFGMVVAGGMVPGVTLFTLTTLIFGIF